MLISSAIESYSSKKLIEAYNKLFHQQIPTINPSIATLNTYNQLQNYSYPILLRHTGLDYDDSDIYILQKWQAQIKKLKFVQNLTEQLIFRDKLRAYLWFLEHNISTVNSEFIKGPVSADNIDQFISKYNKFILKTRRGLQGKGIMFIQGRESLLSILNTLYNIEDQQFLLQPFLPGVEYRYFIINKKVHSVIRKERFSITANANTPTKFSLLDEIPFDKTISSIITKLNSHYYAIDLIDHNGPHVIEINLSAGFELLEQLTQDDIAIKLWQC